jgi:prolyl oligopeptidase
MRPAPILLFALFITFHQASAQLLPYPKVDKVEQVDDYFGTKVSDPYRWLEDDHAPATLEFVKAQNKVTENYLSSIPFRNKVKERLTQLWNFPKWSVPFKGGKNYFVYTNNGLQNQFVLNILRSGPGSKPETFLDPNTLSKDGTVNVSNVSASKDGKYLAYSSSSSGSDWNEIRVMNTSTGSTSNDKVEWVKFSGIAWKGNGFYYSRYDEPDAAAKLKGKNEYHKVYYHSVGNPQKYDLLVYQDEKNPLRNFYAGTTDDERYLIISGSEGSSGNDLIVKDLRNPSSDFVRLVDNFENDYSVIGNDSANLFILTNKNAPRYELVLVNPLRPEIPWKTIIPQSSEVLESVYTGSNYLIAKYMKDAKSLLKIFSRSGQFIMEVPLETLGTVDQLSASTSDDLMFYSLATFTAPSTIYSFNLKTREQKVFFKPELDFKSEEYETRQVFYPSKDGTRIPMFIVHKKGLVYDGNNPTLLYAYGGFNLPQPPIFKIERLVFLENGGVFCLANIRGGGEYGEEWHEAGTKLKKQNVFDDFIAGAEYLIREKITKPEKLGMQGRSNGGLLVGAVMNQRPDLFKVALPVVGVMDMLRYHKFTIGWAWKGDYGSSEDEVNFKNLYGYSPLHNLKEGVNYPATLVTTGDHDDRVVPAHSFKYIATLQEKYKGENPVLIRVDINTGHASTTALGSSKPVAKQIDEQTDNFSFLMYNLGMNP